SQLNKAKEILGFELTKLVHGEEEAVKAQEAARALFTGGANADNMPTTTLAAEDFTDGKVGIIDILVKTAIAKSRGEARRLIEQGGVSLDDEKVTSIDTFVDENKLADGGFVIVKKGKKVFHKITK
ncbi:MAG: tyrosine--tRNA ligase, partial [Clostridia bacterium]|nr:tyrosine--tRNA ligase [Clostridia bacterium]